MTKAIKYILNFFPPRSSFLLERTDALGMQKLVLVQQLKEVPGKKCSHVDVTPAFLGDSCSDMHS